MTKLAVHGHFRAERRYILRKGIASLISQQVCPTGQGRSGCLVQMFYLFRRELLSERDR